MSTVLPERVSARDRILTVAGELFYREGYRAVGVDRVISEADVAKATFYKHFPSKDDLIIAWINHAEQSSLAIVPSSSGPTPLFDYMDAMIGIARQASCMGCTYQGTASEFADPTHPAHATSLQVKQRVLNDLQVRAKKQGFKNSKQVAEAMFLFLEGVWASVRMFRENAPLTHCKNAVRALAQI
jgi:AcrR family transcriptional regulator